MNEPWIDEDYRRAETPEDNETTKDTCAISLGLIGGQQVNQYVGEGREQEERKALISFVLGVPAGNNAVFFSFLCGHE